jgi:hypothetical protein
VLCQENASLESRSYLLVIPSIATDLLF